MAQARPRRECQAQAQPEPEPTNYGQVLNTEFVAEKLEHSGGGGIVDEGYDTKIKIGEALEAAGRAIRGQPVERSDAAAIRAVVGRAVSARMAIPGGVAELVQAATNANARTAHGEDKWDTMAKLLTGKAVMREDVAVVVEMEAAHDPGAATKPYGVGAAFTMAARHKQEDS